MASLIAKHFSPDTADTIFEDGGVIEWLPELINHRWVVYRNESRLSSLSAVGYRCGVRKIILYSF